ncbi:Hypp7238 [Branchiostoma lanceolatum]|uniref:Hypp7238 protein n=1 Tax=Branchiostoma lanceolatum TaxID=7740 RepID=A0A8J9YYQ1_BRALA|nr:Hypp7238 [Branchiostoma lanceolatum]
METDSMATEFDGVFNETLCPEGYNVTVNGTLCARAPIGHPILAEKNILFYLIGVLAFYGCSLLFLLLHFVRSEQEDIELESYYETYIERKPLRDGMSRGFVLVKGTAKPGVDRGLIRSKRAGRPAQISGMDPGLIRGERAGRPGQRRGVDRGLILDERVDKPNGMGRDLLREERVGRPARGSGMGRHLIRGERADSPDEVPRMGRDLIRGKRVGRPVQISGMDRDLIRGEREQRLPHGPGIGRDLKRGERVLLGRPQGPGMNQGLIRKERAGRLTQGSRIDWGFIRGEKAVGPDEFPGLGRDFIRGEKAGRPEEFPGVGNGFILDDRTVSPNGVPGMGRGFIRGAKAVRPEERPMVDRGLIRGEMAPGRPDEEPGVDERATGLNKVPRMGRSFIRGEREVTTEELQMMYRGLIRGEIAKDPDDEPGGAGVSDGARGQSSPPRCPVCDRPFLANSNVN